MLATVCYVGGSLTLICVKDRKSKPRYSTGALGFPRTSRRSARAFDVVVMRMEMESMAKLPYLRTMFATCMLFQVLFVLCAVLWLVAPDLQGHAFLSAVFPGFALLTLGSFIYGLVMSMLYGWAVAIIFVFFYNLWPTFASVLTPDSAVR
jgi:hypothetical protein